MIPIQLGETAARAYLDGADGDTECRWFSDLTDAAHGLGSVLREDDVVLLKGSRSGELERLVEVIAG